MIESISIRNFAIIKDISINFKRNLNIFTGETGTGKSIIVESLAFLFGAKYYSANIKEPVSVSARIRFDKKIASQLKMNETIEIKRIYDSDRKNRYYINLRPVSFSCIHNISNHVMDFHAQMENQVVTSPVAQTEMLDSYAGTKKLARVFFELYQKKLEIKNKINAVLMNESEKKRLLELYEYQLKEIESANLKENEDIELEEIITKTKNTAKIKGICSEMISKAEDDGGILDMISRLVKKSEELSNMDDNFKSLLENAVSIEKSAKIFSDEVKTIFSKYELTESEIDDYIKRDELIKSLKRKYSLDIKGIIEKKNELKKTIEEISFTKENAGMLEKELTKIIVKMEDIAEELNRKRKTAAKKFSFEITKELKKLGFEHCIFDIAIEKSEEFNQYGKNNIEFLFSSNPDHLVKPIRYVASGGEISRIMLAIKCVSAADGCPKIFVFDEIDSAIAGNTAFFVGEALKKLSKTNQILSITHMPQVAVFADAHFSVQKKYIDGVTSVYLSELDTIDERIDEISRMLGSIYSPITAKKHAKELIKKANNFIKTVY